MEEFDKMLKHAIETKDIAGYCDLLRTQKYIEYIANKNEILKIKLYDKHGYDTPKPIYKLREPDRTPYF